jgi:hypothetical protein
MRPRVPPEWSREMFDFGLREFLTGRRLAYWRPGIAW